MQTDKVNKEQELKTLNSLAVQMENKANELTQQAKKEIEPEGFAPTPKEGFAANVRLSKKQLDTDAENLVKELADEKTKNL